MCCAAHACLDGCNSCERQGKVATRCWKSEPPPCQSNPQDDESCCCKLWRKRKLSPSIIRNANQCNKRGDQPTPPSAKTKARTDNDPQKYVVLPHHPLYGCLVTIIKRQVATTYVKCTIEDPAHPGFPYQIREHWLSSSQPPPLPISPTPTEAICLPLFALDTMVKKLLTTPYFRRITDDEHTYHAHDPSPSPRISFRRSGASFQRAAEHN